MEATGWLEMPGLTGEEDFVGTCYAGGKRNYSYHYDRKIFTSMWTAYPLYAATVGGNVTAKWTVNPAVDPAKQIDAGNPYDVNVGSTDSDDYTSAKPYYARGHNIPDADRDNDAEMLAQTYFWTNSTPQIHSGFNSGIWSSLEGAVRNEIPAGDTLYVVTGAAFNKVGENRSITYITPNSETKACPVPNYYWKALLKVKRSGTAIEKAYAIGFWLEHRSYSATTNNERYYDYAVSIDELERNLGIDLFVNLPEAREADAEVASDWTAFTKALKEE